MTDGVGVAKALLYQSARIHLSHGELFLALYNIVFDIYSTPTAKTRCGNMPSKSDGIIEIKSSLHNVIL